MCIWRVYKRPTEGAIWVKYIQNIDSEEKINFTEENENSVPMTRGYPYGTQFFVLPSPENRKLMCSLLRQIFFFCYKNAI